MRVQPRYDRAGTESTESEARIGESEATLA